MVRWLGFLVLVGCYAPTPPEGAPCSDRGTCPSPLVCDVDGTCKKTRVDAAARADAPPDIAGDAAIDAAPDAAPTVCANAPTGSWQNRMPMTVSAPGFVDGTPSMTADGLELYWKSDRVGGNLDIWRSTRPTTAAGWGAPAVVSELNSSVRDGSPEISPDGLTIYLASERASGMALQNDIFIATRPDRASAFGAPTIVPELSSTSDEEGFAVNAAGTIGYLHSDRASAAYHIFRTTRASPADPWGTPVEVSELTDADYENPWVSADDCRMYVQSPRSGSIGPEDLWMVSRPAPGMPWGAPVHVGPPNGPGFQGDPWLTADEKTLIYADGNASTSTLDLYQMQR